MKIFALISLLAITGCASLGLATPKGFDQNLATAYSVHTAVLQATTTALSAGTISSVEAQAVMTQAMQARTLLDTAHTLETANPAGANNDLVLATTALTAIQTYLNARGK